MSASQSTAHSPRHIREEQRSGAIAPQVAVIVPAYGVAHLVGDALRSLQAQTFRNWQAIVIDDGAPDDVRMAVTPFLRDSRIALLETPNGGVSTARNRAIAHSTAPLIALLDGDDLYRPAYLETMTAALAASPDAAFVCCNARTFGATITSTPVVSPAPRRRVRGGITHITLSDVLSRECPIYIGGLFRRSDWERIGGFDPALSMGEDLDFWIRLFSPGACAVYVDRDLGQYRVRWNSASWNYPRMLAGEVRVFEKAVDALVGTLEADIAKATLENVRAELRRQLTMNEVADGDHRAALKALRAMDHGSSGTLWHLSMLVWSIAPRLAPPMLRWRRRRHDYTRSQVQLAPDPIILAPVRGDGPPPASLVQSTAWHHP